MQSSLPSTFEEFATLVARHTADLANTRPTHGSAEWYLLNHLRTLQQNVESSSSAAEVSNSVKAVSRFATDSLEWGGTLAMGVSLIVEAHSSLLRTSRRAPQ